MGMTKSRRLKPLAKLAKNDEYAAARVMNECQRRLDQQVARLDDLKTYRREYDNKLYTSSHSGMEAGALQRYKNFLAKLDEAINLQSQVVDRIRKEYEQKSVTWYGARVRHKSLDKAVERHRGREAARRERREQQQNDERGQRRRHPETQEQE